MNTTILKTKRRRRQQTVALTVGHTLRRSLNARVKRRKGREVVYVINR